MKHFFQFFLPVVLLSFGIMSNLHAQKNFKDGFIITNQNDTVRGQIDYREWTRNPAEITFKDASGKMLKYGPEDILGFQVPGKDIYISRHVSLDLSSLKTTDLASGSVSRSVSDTALFLMVIVQGKASLYYIKDLNEREHFYVEKEGEKPVELLLKKSYKSSNEGSIMTKNYVVTTELYKGQLIVWMSDCPSLKDRINRLSYEKNGLKSLVVEYNQCISANVTYLKKSEKARFKVGLLASPAITTINFTGNQGTYLPQTKFNTCFSYLAGVSFHIVFPRSLARWTLLNELAFKPYSVSGTSTQIDYYYLKYSFTFDMAYLKLNTMVRYQYPGWKVQPFADLGISNGLAVKCKSTKTEIIPNTQKVIEPAIDTRKYEQGLLVGLGLSWWRISGEFRFELSNGMTTSSNLSSTLYSYYFILSIVF